MYFEYTHFLWGIILIPILIGLLLLGNKKSKKFSYLFSNIEIIKKASGSHSKKNLRFFHVFISFFIITFFIIALAKPFILKSDSLNTKKGIDISLAFDVSLSMNATDIKPNRLSASKDTFINFLSNISTDRVSLIIFSGKAFSQTPLTFDYKYLKQVIRSIDTRSIDQSNNQLEGTAIGTAIISAINRLIQTEPERTKIVILITDGETNRGIDPIAAAEFAAAKNIKVYTIGVGKDQNTKIPIGSRFGKTIYANDENGNFKTSKLDEETLQKISDISGGKYFKATNTNELSNIYKEIDRLEKSILIDSNTSSKQYIDYIFIMFGLLFFFIQKYIRYILL
jgi:Ca-activated chloride channel family protein